MVLAVASVGVERELAVVSSICRMVPSSIYASGTKIAPSRYCYHCSTRRDPHQRVCKINGLSRICEIGFKMGNYELIMMEVRSVRFGIWTLRRKSCYDIAPHATT